MCPSKNAEEFSTQKNRRQFLDELNTLFSTALKAENFMVALKVKELEGKEKGFLGTKKSAEQPVSAEQCLQYAITHIDNISVKALELAIEKLSSKLAP